MVSKEKQEFQIRLKIRDKEGKIKELEKKINLEITWQGNKGILNPGDSVSFTDDYGTHNYTPSKGKMVRFEKDSKNYNILVKINEIKKGWFRDEIKEFGGFSPASGSDFTIGSEGKEGLGKPQNSEGRVFGTENSDWKIKTTQLRWKYPILAGVVIFLLLIIIVVYFWNNKRKLLIKGG